MKLRFHSNSLRLRLSQSDVARLGERGLVEEAIRFTADGELHYSIESAATNQLSATFENGSIRVIVPAAQARQWIESDETGIESASGELRVLIEKDFACIHRESAEEDADSFPNPLAPGHSDS
jgi:hypothetical protein